METRLVGNPEDRFSHGEAHLSFVLVLWCSFQYLILLCNHLAEEERVDCFALIVFLFSVDVCPLSLPFGALWLIEAKITSKLYMSHIPITASSDSFVVKSYCVDAPFASGII